jgi:hypothetical protein
MHSNKRGACSETFADIKTLLCYNLVDVCALKIAALLISFNLLMRPILANKAVATRYYRGFCLDFKVQYRPSIYCT